MRWTCLRVLAMALTLGACSSSHHHEPRPVASPDAGTLQPSAAGGFPPSPPSPIGISLPKADLGTACDPTRSVASDGAALIVRDPEVLARFPLERALQQIIATGAGSSSPSKLLDQFA